VNEGYTSRIVGMDEAESASILSEIFAHIQSPDLTYRHKWCVGDFLIWDNCAVQHRAVLDYQLPLRRRMERTTVMGTVPFL
jgi:taurine dioxygenase